MQTDIKKTEKLASALYLLTSFFNDLEPMKWRLRELGGKLVISRENKPVIEEIVGLLNVAKNAGLVSEMNHNIISKEFNNLLEKEIGIPDLMRLPEAVEKIVPKSESSSIVAPERHEERKTSYLPEVTDRMTERVEKSVRDIKVYKTHSENNGGAVALKKNGRQTAIFSLLKKKGEIMIKDVSPMIPGVSEKTIQRELLSLVKQGVLRKEGEKRWSKYSLA